MSSNSIYQEISSLYLAGSTIDQLQKQFHKSFVFIKQALKETNTPLRTPTNFEYDFDTVKSMAEQNYSKKDIVEQLGGSVASLDKFLKSHGTSWKELSPSIFDIYWDQIVECRTVHKMSCIEIVEHLNLPCTTSNIMHKFVSLDIPPLTNDEEIKARHRRNLKRYGTITPSALPEAIEKSKQTKEQNRKHRQLQIELGEWTEPNTLYYVYILKDPIDDKPFYVGKGSNDRPIAHFRAAKNNWKDANQLKINKIRQIMKLGMTPIIETIECKSEQAAFDLEISLIKQWGRRGIDENGILTNMTLGGEGHTFGHRPVDQYNLFGEYIRTFNSCLEAALHHGYKNSSGIVACCKKNSCTKAAHGYFWTYYGEPLDTTWCWNKKHPVVKKDQCGNIVDKFINKSQAGLSVNSTPSAISLAIKTGKLFKGYYWEIF